MDILNKSITEVTFDDIVAFCQEGKPEGFQIDYKLDLPSNGLSKHFSAFSNTRGGIIIVGVEEDRASGIPKTWPGLDPKTKAKSIERIYQWISNVEPRPICDVVATDEKNGRIFILVRVYEGDRPPYFVQNDANLWVRTGSIGDAINIAKPDWVELLFNKREKAQLAREHCLRMAEKIYQAALKGGEHERSRLVTAEKVNHAQRVQRGEVAGDLKSRYYQKELGTGASISKVTLLPYYPREALTHPSEIKAKVMEIRDGDGKIRLDFPHLNPKPTQGGVYSFEWCQDSGRIWCDQLYASGLIYSLLDVLNEENGDKEIYLSHILGQLFQTLHAAANFYQLFGYQGGLVGKLSVDDIEGVLLNRVLGRWSGFPSENIRALIHSYDLDLDLDTSTLFDKGSLYQFFAETAKEVFWDLGYTGLSDAHVEEFLSYRNWKPV